MLPAVAMRPGRESTSMPIRPPRFGSKAHCCCARRGYTRSPSDDCAFQQINRLVVVFGIDRRLLRGVRIDVQVVIEFLGELAEPRQACRTGNAGAAEKGHVAVLMRLQQAPWNLRAVLTNCMVPLYIVRVIRAEKPIF